jgi:hypothetical protein
MQQAHTTACCAMCSTGRLVEVETRAIGEVSLPAGRGVKAAADPVDRRF